MREKAILRQVRTRVSDGAIPGLVLARTYVEGEDLARALSVEVGREVPFVSGKMPKGERARLAALMRDDPAACPVAVATSVWSTGLDIPSLRWVIPMEGQAPIRLLQSAGRAMRPKPDGSTYEIIDISVQSPNGAEHAASRKEHYEEAGIERDVDAIVRGIAAGRGQRRGPRGGAERPQARERPARQLQPQPQPPQPPVQVGSLLWDICGPPRRAETPVLYSLYTLFAILAFLASLGKLLE